MPCTSQDRGRLQLRAATATPTGYATSVLLAAVIHDTTPRLLRHQGDCCIEARSPGEEGDGAPATSNDATWRHRFFDTIFWSTQGGDFSATVSASQSVGAVGQYTWSSAQMVADVQAWLDNPASNFGWLVLGDETAIATAKRFDTPRKRQSTYADDRIHYRAPRSRRLQPRPRPTPAPRP